MNTPGQNQPAQTPGATDLLLAEAMEQTSHDYESELASIKSGPRTAEALAPVERMLAAIESDDFLSPFVDRREFVEWAMYKAADDRQKDASEVSADEVKDALQAPRDKLAANLLDVLETHARSSLGYLRDPLEVLLDDPRAWRGNVGQSMSAAMDDIHVANDFGVDVLAQARDRNLALFDVLNVVRQARAHVVSDAPWRGAGDPAAAKAAAFLKAFESALAAGTTAEAAAVTGPGMACCGPPVYALSEVPLETVLPRETAWARKSDPCNSMDYLRYLVYTYAIGETGQLFRAGELLADRWAQATNWCWPAELAEQTGAFTANCQGFDDRMYRLRRHTTRTDTAYAMRATIYQEQLENPALQQAWGTFLSNVQGYLSAPCTPATVPSYRCLAIYTAAEALRRTAAAQLTSLARMQIKDLASSLQLVLRLFNDPRVAGIINPAAAGGWPPGSTAGYTGTDPDDQAVTAFGVAQQLLGPQASGLYQAWDRAILLDQVFAWIQEGPDWHPVQGCEEDGSFVTLLGAVSALLPGTGPASPATTLASLPVAAT